MNIYKPNYRLTTAQAELELTVRTWHVRNGACTKKYLSVKPQITNNISGITRYLLCYECISCGTTFHRTYYHTGPYHQ